MHDMSLERDIWTLNVTKLYRKVRSEIKIEIIQKKISHQLMLWRTKKRTLRINNTYHL